MFPRILPSAVLVVLYGAVIGAAEGEFEEVDVAAWEHEHDSGLLRLDGVSVGHEQWVTVTFRTQTGARKKRPILLRTLSLQPLIFEIPGFLTSEECKGIIDQAKEVGMSMSLTVDDMAEKEDREREVESATRRGGERMSAEDKDDMFKEVDRDMNGLLSIAEMDRFLRRSDDTAMTHEDIKNMMMRLDIDRNKDGWLSQREFFDINEIAIKDYLSQYRENNPISRRRYSQQTWISNGEGIFADIQKRVQEVTRLRMDVIINSESLQVVHYTQVGHYNCHHDSDPLTGPDDGHGGGDEDNEGAKDKWMKAEDNEQGPPCCHHDFPLGEVCRLCRLLTMMFYLNDVEDGGATAFPAVGNSRYLTSDKARKDFEDSHLCNLTSYCGESGLVIQPERGKALLWYNHFLNSNGEIGSLDLATLHGGCGVRRGTKWIANAWIDYEPFMIEKPPDPEQQVLSYDSWLPKAKMSDTCGGAGMSFPPSDPDEGSCQQP